jgi:hypothetical protein
MTFFLCPSRVHEKETLFAWTMILRRVYNGVLILTIMLNICAFRFFNRRYLCQRKRKSVATTTSLSVGPVQEIESLSAAFIGGTLGVMGTMMALEIKTKQDGGLDACPYCMGHGEILCGRCLGTGSMNGAPCEKCSCNGAIMCINCKGDGRLSPLILQNKVVREPDSAYQGVLTRTSTIDNP